MQSTNTGRATGRGGDNEEDDVDHSAIVIPVGASGGGLEANSAVVNVVVDKEDSAALVNLDPQVQQDSFCLLIFPLITSILLILCVILTLIFCVLISLKPRRFGRR